MRSEIPLVLSPIPTKLRSYVPNYVAFGKRNLSPDIIDRILWVFYTGENIAYT